MPTVDQIHGSPHKILHKIIQRENRKKKGFLKNAPQEENR